MLQTRQEKVSEPVGLSSKASCPGFCNKEPRSTGRAGGGLWEHRRGLPAPVVRLALAFLPPAALTLLTGSYIVSAEAVCDLQNETILPVVCYGSPHSTAPPPPSPPSDLSIFVQPLLMLVTGQNTHPPWDVISPFKISPNSV